MNFALFHIGSPLPEHVTHCVRQIQHTNPGKRIYLITDPGQTVPNGVEYIDRTDLIVPDIGSYFLHHDHGVLFRNALLRIFYLESFMKKYNIEDVIHFDNDILIYYNIDIIAEQLSGHDMLMTAHNEKQYVFGFSYMRNHNSMTILCRELLRMTHMHDQLLWKTVDDWPSEMRLLNYVNGMYGYKLVSLLPVLPYDDTYSMYNFCFDPSSYGQYLGGLAPESHHYIGRVMIAGRLKVYLKDKLPYGMYNDKEYSIFNLHIWNKKLEDFITYE